MNTRLRCCLKVDVDTYDGMRYGVPTLLTQFKENNVRATFFLSFGPDNAGKAIWNVFRKQGFLRKMVRTRAPSLYGWRTLVSGTLLPPRMIGKNFPNLVRRIVDEGHEVGVHCWDHRLWQDRLHHLGRMRIQEQFEQSFSAYESILGTRPRSVAAPAWHSTPTSLEIQDTLGLTYASDTRGGTPCYPELGSYRSTTLQIPTTQPCLEELLATGLDREEETLSCIVSPAESPAPLVIPLHAEVEGGIYESFLAKLLVRMREADISTMTLLEYAEELLANPASIPVQRVFPISLPGRSGNVIGNRSTPGPLS